MGPTKTLPEIERIDMGSLSPMYLVKSALLQHANERGWHVKDLAAVIRRQGASPPASTSNVTLSSKEGLFCRSKAEQ